ncbi:MAG: rod shape-determining protein MreD [Leptospiraceae bacterium]|nr:rod shape-determining protein MreD [Leptospiraceae bacterium]MCK6381780.1 rod shape-determining protein MreD [Leptospiraceae bacterium]NUM40622.1 rod shape-determining protein MreD [Leptospiraceae bacterium]
MILEKIVIFSGILIAYFLNGSNLFELGKNIKPDFMILIVTFFALRKGALSGLWVGFVGGLLSDAGLGGEISSTGMIQYKVGLHSMSFSILGYLIGKFGRAAYNENLLSVFVANFIVTLVSRIFTYFLFVIFFHSNENYGFLVTSLYNGAISPIVFFLLTWAYRLEPVEGSKI